MTTGKKLPAIAAMTILAVASATSLQAQDGRTEPSAGIEDPPRTFDQINHARGGKKNDSTVAGAITGSPRNESRITLPEVCDLDPGAYGCPSFCEHNPSHAECLADEGGVGTPAPPPDGGGGRPTEWCGIPYPMWPEPDKGGRLDGQEKCNPVPGGFDCGGLHHRLCQ